MKKFGRFAVAAAMAAVLTVSGGVLTASAQQGDLLFGQKHYYSVMFRGNGEAIVLAKIVVTNSGDQAFNTFSFSIPKASVSELTVLQQGNNYYYGGCLRYDYSYGQARCAEYEHLSYLTTPYPYYNNGSPGDYQKAKFTQSGNLYNVTLPSYVMQNQSTTIVVAYAAKGYASKGLGGFNFNFETLQVPSRISDVQVAVDVDSELFLAGKRSSVNYQTSAVNDFAAKGGLAATSLSSPEMSRVVDSIGSYGPVTKTAKNLAPNESLVVKGEYAQSRWLLNLDKIIWAVLIVAALIAGIYYLRKYLKSRVPAAPAVLGAAQPQSSILAPFQSLFWLSVGVGFLSAFLLVGLSALLPYLDDLLAPFRYGNDVLPVVLFLAIALVYLGLAVGPGIWLGAKKAWKALGYFIASEIVWLIVLGILYSVLIAPTVDPYYRMMY